ncbi:septation ring formation regulator EzrA [Macrococcus armenti]|uniref:septation ring formation regulator EzrA n=1 Tax=Macrococcus armenti TaxID=2875764 RepID=UPI001CCEABB3|nr:septation ring formation regulator EzrA [Macrococcus armenti]UBH09745.1 septation ring formation regulator EzrA [Macrococcus armenti]UBH12056.1 septation ring formation regulator EzrA [Macrococcus armenti]UBH16542.1 septation ring formation regulator EzrA [Macrococcus armenti]UBH18905.1 septation ring formation regulator EzrA [Macrococcus armenti]UBH21173.1 septation ring formation regulator EzrA [Macrococcus armenti]
MMLYVIVGIIVIILIVIGVLFYMRNQRRSSIETIEQRKNEIQQLPFQDELVKVKALNLKGQAVQHFDKWKREWQTVLNEDLKSCELIINDADEALDKFKFKESEEKVQEANVLLDQIEKKYEVSVNEIQDYMAKTSEDERKYDDCRIIYRESKRDVLANRHQYGESAGPLEAQIETYEPQIEVYQKHVNEGNYDDAHLHITALHQEMTCLKVDMEEIPELIRDVQKELPAQFQDIRFGCRDLKLEGYNLEHVKVDSTLQTLKGKLNLVEPLIARLELDKAEAIIDEINDSIDEMVELVELEVKAKNNVELTKEEITDQLFHAKDTNYMIRTEIEYVKDTYYINEEDIQNVRQYDNEIQSLITVYDEILMETAKSSIRYTEVEDNLKYIETHVKVINEKQEKIQNYLTNLREDEQEAQRNTLKIQSKKEEVYRKLLASNLSSVPERFIIMKNEIDVETREVHQLFNKRPMNVTQVRDKVNKVLATMNTFEAEAMEVLEHAQYAEQLIQYGNRYRKDHAEVNKDLNEAERLFANNRYKRAVEVAEAAIECVEPGATERIEEIALKHKRI